VRTVRAAGAGRAGAQAHRGLAYGCRVARISPLPEDQWDDEVRSILDVRMAGTDVRLGDNNIFTTLARHQGLFRVWLRFAGWLLGRGVLPARERELLILRTGYNCGSPYEWGQHVRLSEQLGIDRETIVRVAEGPDVPGWSPADATLLRAADELHESAKVSPETWARLGEHYDERGLIEITMLVGNYHLVAFALNSLEVELDEGLEGLPGGASEAAGGKAPGGAGPA
jgi:4-carboxymuconolactone decarboxylase